MPNTPRFTPRYYRPNSARRGSCPFLLQPEHGMVFPCSSRVGGRPRVQPAHLRSARMAGK